MRVAFHLNKLESPTSKDALSAKFDWNCPSGFWEEDFKISSMYLCYFMIISHWKRIGPFIWTNLNPLQPIMLCATAKFGWNWPIEKMKMWKVYNDNDRQLTSPRWAKNTVYLKSKWWAPPLIKMTPTLGLGAFVT